MLQVFSCRAEDLENQIRRIISSNKAEIGVAVLDLSDGNKIEINSDEKFPMQSVFKLPISIKILYDSDMGKFRLSDSIFIEKSDLLPDTWSPIREKYPEGNIKMTIGDIVRYTIIQSDNNACDILLKMAGGPNIVDEYLQYIRINDISIKWNEAEQHDNPQRQNDNFATPKAAVNLLMSLYYNNILKRGTQNFLMNAMGETVTGSIRDSIPKNVEVFHKTGSAFDVANKNSVANDIGIMTLPNGTTAFYAIFIKNSAETEKKTYGIIAQIGKCIYSQLSAK